MAGEVSATVSLIDGLSEVLASDVGVQHAQIEAAEKILAKAKDYCPVDTGKLVASGRIETDFDGAYMISHIIFGGGNVDYAAYVEFGTNDTPAFAFLRRAMEGGVE